jgi:hypothetical protein
MFISYLLMRISSKSAKDSNMDAKGQRVGKNEGGAARQATPIRRGRTTDGKTTRKRFFSFQAAIIFHLEAAQNG